MKQRPKVERIVSGGQTGADRGALDAAIEVGIPHGGYCPRGRIAEDGRISDRYQLTETASESYEERTGLNVIESDATLILTHGALTGGSRLTKELAEGAGRPTLHLDLSRLSAEEAAVKVREWLSRHQVSVLNVAGSRESLSPGLCAAVKQLLRRVFSP